MPALPVRLTAALATLLLLVTAARADTLPAPLAASLVRANIPEEAVAVLVQKVDEGTPLLSHRADAPMNPASVMKLITAQVALARLGPAFTWKTRVLAHGEIRDGVLHGPLYITGGGDPRLSRERLWLLLRELRAQGIRRIAGDVVTDRSLFRLAPHDPAAFDQRPLRPYNAGADALSVDYGAIRLRVQPTADGARVLSDPPPAGLVIENRIRRNGNGACGDPTAQLTAVTTETGGQTRLGLGGTLPAGCTEAFDWNLAPLPPDRLFEGLFRSLWRELGGEIGGQFTDGRTPPEARLLAETSSPPLPEVLRDMNKWSNNVIARHLLATLGAAAEPEQDSAAAGRRVVEGSLAASGIDTGGFVIENGAGLSRSARISARSLGQLLQSAWRSPTMPELLASLPIAGIDGTARRRLTGSPAAGLAHVKTGTLDGVRSLAGYVRTHSGPRYAVVLMINHPNAGSARDAQDALLEWVAGL